MIARRAMSVVELVVAAGVVGVLLGVALPALRAGREAARETTCAAGSRTLQSANEMHAVEHDERYAPGARVRVEAWSGRAMANLERWHGTRESASQPFRPDGGALTAYLGGAGTSGVVRECPSFMSRLEELRQARQGFESGAGGYGYNNAFVGTDRVERPGEVWVAVEGGLGRGARRGQFASPARTIAFADAAFAGDEGVIEYSFVEPVFWPDMAGMRPDPSVHFRHRGNANVVWLDGSVSSEIRSFSAWSGLYQTDPAGVGIGWFGTNTGNELFDYE